MEQDNFQPSEEGKQSRPRKNILSVFIPKGNYFFTPIIININIAVYLLMVLSGVDPMFPDSDAVLKWGADFRPLTMNGEPWRLLTATFLHFGLLHIAVNMLSLYNIGRMLEPFIGRWRFLVVYLCSGIGASVISIWWNDVGVSAGASGAIVGIVGVLGALVAMPNLVRSDVRMSLLRSIGQSLLLLVIIGMNGFVDNAGHFGGLAVGAVCGFLIYFEVKAWYEKKKQGYYFLLLSVLATAGICIYFWTITPKPNYTDPNQYFNEVLNRYEVQKNYAENNIEKAKEIPMSVADIDREIIYPLNKCVLMSDTLMSNQGLSDLGKKIAYTLGQYAETRLTEADFLKQIVKENKAGLSDSVAKYDAKAVQLDIEIKTLFEAASKKPE